MNDKLKSLGALIKENRLRTGKSIEDIAKETHIREKYLRAIEEGERSLFPADIYLQGYLKAFARSVGLDPAEILNMYKEALGAKSHEINYIEPREKPGITSKRILPLSWGGIIMIAGAAVILLSIIIFVKGKRDKFEQMPSGIKIESVLDSTIARRLLPAGEGISQSVMCKIGPINPAWAIGRVDSVTLDVEVKETTTLLVETDYRRAFKGTVTPGMKKTWRAKDSFFLTVGKPQALRLWFNGFPLIPLPPKLTAMDLYITRQNVLSLIEGAKPATSVSPATGLTRKTKKTPSPYIVPESQTPETTQVESINIEE